MIKQVVVIGGGNSFRSHEDYLSYLKNTEVSLDKFKQHKDWKDILQEKLGKNFEVLQPKMPNKTNARYDEWKIWFERMIPFLKKNVIIIGHSLGGIFLAKYLSENNFPITIKATILVSAPFAKDYLIDFKLPSSLARFVQQGGIIYLIHSKDDEVVTFDHFEKYRQSLQNAKTKIFYNRGHFIQETFPEIVKLIRSL
jgi:predicted alpha/beta hydrolase family esterase